MKKCKHCQTEIDSKAKVCPNCHKKQGMSTLLIVVLVIFGIAVISSFSIDESANNEKQSGKTQEDITLLDDHQGIAKDYSYEITGTLQNNTDEDYSYINVDFYVYDSEGNLLDTCSAYNDGFESKGKWKFTASCPFIDNPKAVDSYKLKEISKW